MKVSNGGKTVDMSGMNVSKIPMEKLSARKVTNFKASGNRLKNLSELKKFTNLVSCDLSRNQISSVKGCFSSLRRLTTLHIGDNEMNSLDDFLDSVSELPSLQNLSLTPNKFVPEKSKDPKIKNLDYQRFRLYVLHQLPGLKVLDGVKVTNVERESSERTGAFCRIQRIHVPAGNVTEHNIEEEEEEDPKRIRSYFGYTKKEYIGMNSQGNRFIKDL